MTINMLCLGAVGQCSILLTIAQKQGLFKKHGVEVQLVPVMGVEIPEPTLTNPIAYIGAPAALMRAATGADIKIVACFDTARLSSCLVVKSEISRPDQLRGKRLGARVTGAAMWIHTVLALEKLGLKPERDQIEIIEVGDPRDVVEALGEGRIDGAVLPRAQCDQLIHQGEFSILLDLSPCHVYGAPDALVATASLVKERSDLVEAIVAALIEAAALIGSSRHRVFVLEAIKLEFKITDDLAAETGLRELLKVLARNPYPSVERISDLQRIMALRNPAVLGASTADLVDDRVVRKLDYTGFIDVTYASYSRI